MQVWESLMAISSAKSRALMLRHATSGWRLEAVAGAGALSGQGMRSRLKTSNEQSAIVFILPALVIATSPQHVRRRLWCDCCCCHCCCCSCGRHAWRCCIPPHRRRSTPACTAPLPVHHRDSPRIFDCMWQDEIGMKAEKVESNAKSRKKNAIVLFAT